MKYCATCKETAKDESQETCPKCGKRYIEIAVQQESGDCAFCKFLEHPHHYEE